MSNKKYWINSIYNQEDTLDPHFHHRDSRREIFGMFSSWERYLYKEKL